MREPTPAREHFHLALIGILVPPLAFFVSAGLSIYNLFKPSEDPAHAPWTRRLFGLAVVDFLVFLVMGMMAQGTVSFSSPKDMPPRGPRIGVVLEEEVSPRGVVVKEVSAGSPAEKAGIEPGDVIERVDGEPVSSNEKLVAILARTPSGEARTLSLHRHGDPMSMSVVPEVPARKTGPKAPLFEIRGPPEPVSKNLWPLAGSWISVAVPLLLLALFAWRKKADLRPRPWAMWLAFLGILGLSSAAMVGAYAGLQGAMGGRSLGASLLSLSVGSGTMLLGALLFRWRLSRAGGLGLAEEGSLPMGAGVLRGIGYLFAGVFRVGIVLAGVSSLLHIAKEDPGKEIRALVAEGMGPGAIALLIFAAVVLAPLAEETLFRGILLPWLARFMSVEAAVVFSAVMFGVAHLRYGLYLVTVVVYGVVLGWARVATGTTRASIALHMFINGMATLVVLAQT